MRILQVITSLRHGGAERLVVDISLALRRKGHDVEVAVFDAVQTSFMDDLQSQGVKVHRFAPLGKSPYHPSHLLALRRLIKQGGYDVVHTHNTACQLYGALCPLPSGTVLVTTEHNTSNRRRGNTLLRYVDRLMYARYDHIVCISELTSQLLNRHLGQVESTGSSVISNGVDIARFWHPIKEGVNDPVNVTMIAGFRPQKDQDTLIRAIALLPERYRLRLIGDGERRETLETLVRDLGCESRIEMAGVRADIPDVLGEADIVAMSSHYEGLSLSSVEALASGRPLVATDVDGLREVVSGAGVLVPEGDAQALARAIESLAEDITLYRNTAAQCQHAAKQYDIAHTVDGYERLYKKLLND